MYESVLNTFFGPGLNKNVYYGNTYHFFTEEPYGDLAQKIAIFL